MQYIPGHGFRAVPSLPRKPVRGMPSLKGKLKKKPDWEPPKPKKKTTRRKKTKAKTTRTARVSAAPKKQLPKMKKKRGWFW